MGDTLDGATTASTPDTTAIGGAWDTTINPIIADQRVEDKDRYENLRGDLKNGVFNFGSDDRRPLTPRESLVLYTEILIGHRLDWDVADFFEDSSALGADSGALVNAFAMYARNLHYASSDTASDDGTTEEEKDLLRRLALGTATAEEYATFYKTIYDLRDNGYSSGQYSSYMGGTSMDAMLDSISSQVIPPQTRAAFFSELIETGFGNSEDRENERIRIAGSAVDAISTMPDPQMQREFALSIAFNDIFAGGDQSYAGLLDEMVNAISDPAVRAEVRVTLYYSERYPGANITMPEGYDYNGDGTITSGENVLSVADAAEYTFALAVEDPIRGTMVAAYNQGLRNSMQENGFNPSPSEMYDALVIGRLSFLEGYQLQMPLGTISVTLNDNFTQEDLQTLQTQVDNEFREYYRTALDGSLSLDSFNDNLSDQDLILMVTKHAVLAEEMETSILVASRYADAIANNSSLLLQNPVNTALITSIGLSGEAIANANLADGISSADEAKVFMASVRATFAGTDGMMDANEYAAYQALLGNREFRASVPDGFWENWSSVDEAQRLVLTAGLTGNNVPLLTGFTEPAAGSTYNELINSINGETPDETSATIPANTAALEQYASSAGYTDLATMNAELSQITLSGEGNYTTFLYPGDDSPARTPEIDRLFALAADFYNNPEAYGSLQELLDSMPEGARAAFLLNIRHHGFADDATAFAQWLATETNINLETVELLERTDIVFGPNNTVDHHTNYPDQPASFDDSSRAAITNRDAPIDATTLGSDQQANIEAYARRIISDSNNDGQTDDGDAYRFEEMVNALNPDRRMLLLREMREQLGSDQAFYNYLMETNLSTETAALVNSADPALIPVERSTALTDHAQENGQLGTGNVVTAASDATITPTGYTTTDPFRANVESLDFGGGDEGISGIFGFFNEFLGSIFEMLGMENPFEEQERRADQQAELRETQEMLGITPEEMAGFPAGTTGEDIVAAVGEQAITSRYSAFEAGIRNGTYQVQYSIVTPEEGEPYMQMTIIDPATGLAVTTMPDGSALNPTLPLNLTTYATQNGVSSINITPTGLTSVVPVDTTTTTTTADPITIVREFAGNVVPIEGTEVSFMMLQGTTVANPAEVFDGNIIFADDSTLTPDFVGIMNGNITPIPNGMTKAAYLNSLGFSDGQRDPQNPENLVYTMTTDDVQAVTVVINAETGNFVSMGVQEEGGPTIQLWASAIRPSTDYTAIISAGGAMIDTNPELAVGEVNITNGIQLAPVAPSEEHASRVGGSTREQ